MKLKIMWLGLFCVFVLLVFFLNYDMATIIARYGIESINFIAGRDDFYILGGRGVAMGMYLSFGANPMCFLVVSLISLMAYFLNQRLFLSICIACVGFIVYCVFFPHFRFYFFVKYFTAFTLALCEIKMLYALQNYLNTKRFNE